MIWIYAFALVLLMTWSLQSFAAQFSRLWDSRRRRALESSAERGFDFFIPALTLVLTDPAPASNQRQALCFQGARLRSWPQNLLWAALTSLGLWGAAFMALSFTPDLGLWLVAGGGAVTLLPFVPTRAKAFAWLFIFWGLQQFATGSAQLLLARAMNQDTGNITMFLADGRLGAVALWWLLGVVEGLLFGTEFLAFSAGLAGVASGLLSVNGAVAFWLGERVGLALRTWLETRGRTTSVRKLAGFVAFTCGPAALLGLCAWGFARDWLEPVTDLGPEGLALRLNLFVFGSVFCEAFILLAQSLVAHRMQGRTPEDLFEIRGSRRSLFEPLADRPETLEALRAGLGRRRDELKRLHGEFNQISWQKVPPAVRATAEKELASIEELLAGPLLSSGSGFFRGQSL